MGIWYNTTKVLGGNSELLKNLWNKKNSLQGCCGGGPQLGLSHGSVFTGKDFKEETQIKVRKVRLG